MKYVLICLFSLYSFVSLAQQSVPGPVTVGLCPPAKDCPSAPAPAPAPKPAPKAVKKCPKCQTCPTCPPEKTVTVEKKVEVETYKKNTISVLLGRGRDGINYTLHNSDILLHKGYGIYTGLRYERRIDPTWSVSGEWLTTESANLGLGISF